MRNSESHAIFSFIDSWRANYGVCCLSCLTRIEIALLLLIVFWRLDLEVFGRRKDDENLWRCALFASQVNALSRKVTTEASAEHQFHSFEIFRHKCKDRLR